MKRKRRKLIILIVVIFAGALLLFFAIKVIKSFRDIGLAFENDLPATYTFLPEDTTIISKAYQDRFKVKEVFNFRKREPISMLELDSRYYLIITKIKLSEPATAKEVIHVSNEGVDRTSGETYSILGLNDFFEYQYLPFPLEPASNLYLTLAGDSLTSEWNDSIARFHLLAENLSVRYGKDAPIDIILAPANLSFGAKVKQSVDVLLLFRGRRAYFLLMTPIMPGISIAPDLLYNVVSGN